MDIRELFTRCSCFYKSEAAVLIEFRSLITLSPRRLYLQSKHRGLNVFVFIITDVIKLISQIFG
jgi:hypothetical protein